MATVSIYLLSQVGEEALPTICKLCDQFSKAGRKIYCYTPDGDVAYTLDDALWTLLDKSFIPHERFTGVPIEMPLPTVLIGALEAPETHRDVLINLDLSIPAWYSQASRVVEVVPKGTEVRAACRARFKKYRDAGHEVKTFEQSEQGKWAARA